MRSSDEPTADGSKFFYSEKEKRSKVTARPPPCKPKYVSASLPCSATSSPQNNSIGFKKLYHPPRQPHPAMRSFARQSSSALSRFAIMQDASFSRSKSCGEGRSSAPTDEFDILAQKAASTQRLGSGAPLIDECYENSTDYKEIPRKEEEKQRNSNADFFKCSTLCLYLPSFSRKKPLQLPTSRSINNYNQQELVRPSTISLERFECESWSSGLLVEDFEEEEEESCYFDLPLELIRSCGNETDSPVRTAFVFDSDPKGALKMSRSHLGASNSCSTSSSSDCITPRLEKDREDFNAFLEAQN